MEIIGKCQHNMAIYKKDGETIHTCSYCRPPEKDLSRSMCGYKRTYVEDFMTDESLDILKTLPYRLTFIVPEWSEVDFYNDFIECSGRSPMNNEPGIYHSNAKTKIDKRWYSATFEFKFDDSLVFEASFTDRIKMSRKKDWVQINSIHLAGYLLANGFQPGSHNKD